MLEMPTGKLTQVPVELNDFCFLRQAFLKLSHVRDRRSVTNVRT